MTATDPFINFLILLVISAAVSAILHYGLRYYVTPGGWSFVSKVVVGYIGAALGTPLLGKWWEGDAGVTYGDISFLPAIVGAFALLILAIDLMQMVSGKPANGE